MTLTRRSFTALALASVAMPAFAATEPRWYNDGGDLAASGRDVVAYFGLSRGDGVMGSEEFATMHKGTTFHFANAENLATFQGDPDKYIRARWALRRASHIASGDKNWMTHFPGER